MDKLAKRALVAAIHHRDFISSSFPFEAIRVEINNVKVTGSPRTSIVKHWGDNAARQLYHDKHIINKIDFDLVWWDGSEKAVYDFPKMFRVFVTKQTSKFCGTNRQLSRIGPR